jgi:RNA polymerase sigma-70 factor (ECF subfamily)
MRPAPPLAIVDALVAGQERRLPMDERAFHALYARTAGPLLGYLRRLTGSHAVAEDLMQDAFVRFLTSSAVPDADDHQRHYLFRIATNLARDHFRRAQRQRPMTSGHDVAVAPAASDGDVWARLGGLSTRDRELLLLAYVEGCSHEEIAAITGLMRASVRLLLFRARKRFAAELRAAGLDRVGERS